MQKNLEFWLGKNAPLYLILLSAIFRFSLQTASNNAAANITILWITLLASHNIPVESVNFSQ